MLALFCSRRCPGTLIVRTYDLAIALREGGVPVISGFHTPMEREALAFLLRPVIGGGAGASAGPAVTLCPARGAYDPARLPAAWRAPIAVGRLAVWSPFPDDARRPTRALAAERNRRLLLREDVTAALVIHAAPGGETEALCRELAALRSGLTRLTLADPANANLAALGFAEVSPEEAVAAWRAATVWR